MRLYRLLLFAFPASLRREFGDDMAEMFAMQVDAARRGRRGVVRLWMRAIADAASGGLQERLGGVKPPRFRGRSYMRAFVQDLKYAVRMLVRQPGVTVIVVLTLALGIGANTAIFSAVNAVLLRPLPYEDPDRVVTVWEKRQAEGVLDNVVSPADFLDWARMNTSFESMAAMTSTSVDLTGRGEPDRLYVGLVSPPFFDLLRVRPALGRTFTRDEGIVGKPRGVLLTHKLWASRFGSDPSIVGRSLTLSGNAIDVVGVLPASFEFPDESLDLWAPLALEGTTQPLSRTNHEYFVYARLKPGVTLQQARGDMERVGALPGARGAGATSHLPLSGRDGRRGVTIEGREPTPDTPTRAHPRIVTPGYMEAMGITILAGRAFTDADREGAAAGGDRQRDDGAPVLAGRLACRTTCAAERRRRRLDGGGRCSR
jgi:hypothetical protein